MITVLDAGALSALLARRERLRALGSRGQWPPHVPSVVLTEALTGDHRRDHAVNRLLGNCVVSPVDEPLARQAAALRTATGRAGTISAVDAVVAAYAVAVRAVVVLTSDPDDLWTLREQAQASFDVRAV